MANRVFLGLGSNKGDRKKFIFQAIDAISNYHGCIIRKISSLYETTPYGLTDQQNFYNAVIEIEIDFPPDELYEAIKQTEREIGRQNKSERWGPREIDVDILFYNNLIYNSDKLVIPHKEILKRDFVIVPLIEIAGDFVHPVAKKKLRDIDLSVIEKHIVRKIDFLTNHTT